MQCSSINLHFASSSTFYPHSSLNHNLNTKSCSFQPSLKVTPSLPQQQHKKTHPLQEQGRPSHYSTHHHLQGSDSDGNPKLITSVSNPFVKHCLKLRNSSSYRRSHGSVLVVGATPIREIYRFQESLQDGSIRMDCLILPDKAEIPTGLDKATSSIVHASSIVMRKISGLQSTDSIDAIAVMKIPASFFDVDGDRKKADCKKWFPCAHRILVLDGIQDPGNLGTLLRSAVAFRWVRNYPAGWSFSSSRLLRSIQRESSPSQPRCLLSASYSFWKLVSSRVSHRRIPNEVACRASGERRVIQAGLHAISELLRLLTAHTIMLGFRQ